MKFSELKARYVAGTLSKPDYIREALEQHAALFGYAEAMAATDVCEIRITPEGVVFRMREQDIVLHCPSGEARVAPIEILNFDAYEPAETAVMAMLSEHAQVILDIGANIGWYSVWFAKRNPAARIHAFEPMPRTHAYLQRNLAENAVGARVTAFNYGLSDAAGTVEFFVAPGSGTNASLKNVAGASDAHAVTGLTLTLDQWVSNHGVVPEFIKCDVEGAEFLVFRGGRQTLERCKPVVFTEMLRKWSAPFGYHPTEVISFFADLGYVCFAIGSEGVRVLTEVDEQTVETNYAFLHVSAHADMIRRLERMQ